jgi:hypothetical protein
MKPTKTTGGLSRRDAIIGSPALGALAMSTPALANSSSYGRRQWTSEFLNLDMTEHFHQAMRLQRSMLDEDDILHWYHFVMFAVPVGRSPQPVVRWEGIELSRHRKLAPDVFRTHGHNLSFARDLATGRFTDRVLNPVTGRWVSPTTMALTQDPGYITTPRGTLPLDKPGGEPRPKYGMIRREGDVVKIDSIRVAPATWPATFVETGFEAAPLSAFNDRSQLWLPTDVSGAYVFPWPEWMEMEKDAPGHMMAAWSGYKLRSIDQLPKEFRQRAERDRPDLLHVDLKLFDRPFPLPN